VSGSIKDKKVIPCVVVLVSVISVITAAYFAWSANKIAKEANVIAKEAEEKTQKIILAEKRPYLNINIAKLETGQYLNIEDSKGLSATYRVEVRNKGIIPANNISVKMYLFSDERIVYKIITLEMPDLQKLFSDNFYRKDVTLSSDKEDSDIYKAIQSGELQLQVEVNYKSEVDETLYQTKKQFIIKRDNVSLIANFGEFK
jgi:hypothetical protein